MLQQFCCMQGDPVRKGTPGLLSTRYGASHQCEQKRPRIALATGLARIGNILESSIKVVYLG